MVMLWTKMGNRRGGRSLVEKWAGMISGVLGHPTGAVQEAFSSRAPEERACRGRGSGSFGCRDSPGSIRSRAFLKSHLLRGPSLTFLTEIVALTFPVPLPGHDLHYCFNHDPTLISLFTYYILSLFPQEYKLLWGWNFWLFCSLLYYQLPEQPWHTVGLQQIYFQ